MPASFTRAQVREKLLIRLLGYYPGITVDENSTPSTVRSTDARYLPDGIENDGFEGSWLFLTSGDRLAEAGLITSYEISGNVGVLTIPEGIFGDAGLPEGTKAVITRRSPHSLHDVINAACLELYPALSADVRDESQTFSGALKNPSLEKATASAVPEWTVEGSPTIEAVAEGLHGGAVRITPSAGEAARLTQLLDLSLTTAQNNSSITLGGFIRSTDRQDATISLGGVVEASSDYRFSLSNVWGWTEVRGPIPQGGQDVTAVIEIAAGADPVDLDAFYAYGGTYRRYPVPDEFIDWPSAVYVQQDRFEPAGYYLPLSRWQRAPTEDGERFIAFGPTVPVHAFSGLYLRMESRTAIGRELVDGGDDAKIEVGDAQVEILIEKCMQLMKLRMAETEDRESANQLRREAAINEERVARLLRRGGSRKRRGATFTIPTKYL